MPALLTSTSIESPTLPKTSATDASSSTSSGRTVTGSFASAGDLLEVAGTRVPHGGDHLVSRARQEQCGVVADSLARSGDQDLGHGSGSPLCVRAPA